MALKYSIAQDCRIGARRNNQDRIGYWSSEHALLMVVADGMGGHPRGELAAQIAVDRLVEDFVREARPRLTRPDEFLLQAFGHAHRSIIREARDIGLPDAPRTVLVACVVQDGTVTWTHVGDSRAYLIRCGAVVTRTHDHSYVQHLVDVGRISEDQAGLHPERNLVLRCVGGDDAPHVLQVPQPESIVLKENDVVLLCSDGFWGSLTADELLAGLPGRALQEEVDALVRRAEQRAGAQCDNVSVMAIVWNEPDRRGEPSAGVPNQT